LMITAALPAPEITPAARARIAERACRWLIPVSMMIASRPGDPGIRHRIFAVEWHRDLGE
jgi:hypothetical protein